MEVTQLQAAGTGYTSPFIGPTDHRINVNVDLSGLTDDEIDAGGYIKPGTPLQLDGTLVDGVSQYAGMIPEAIKVLPDNATATIAAAGVKMLGLVVGGVAGQKIAEDNLGRVLSANEIAALKLQGFTLQDQV